MRIKELSEITILLETPKGIDKIPEIDLGSLMSIDEDNLTQEYETISVLFSTFAVLAAHAQSRELNAKFEFEVITAQLNKEMRIVLSNQEEKVTDRMVDSAVKIDKRYREKWNEYLKAKKQHTILLKLEASLKIKKDMVFSLASDKRKEIK